MGDFEIVKTIGTLATASVYQARRRDSLVMLKIAHEGHQEKLKREAAFLQQHRHPVLPRLLPAHAYADLRQHYYGKLALQGEARYYYVCQYVEGESLRRVLAANPQPWYQAVGWLIVSLTDAMALLHERGLFHLALTPDVVLVRFDEQDIPRPLLLDLGAASSFEDIPRNWNGRIVPLAYTAPELITKEVMGEATDVYGLGLLLYEMLAGRPAYDSLSQNRVDVYRRLLSSGFQSVNRPDLMALPDIAERSISRHYRDRPPSILSLAHELLQLLPPVPREKNKQALRLRALWIAACTAAAVAFLIAIAMVIALG